MKDGWNQLPDVSIWSPRSVRVAEHAFASQSRNQTKTPDAFDLSESDVISARFQRRAPTEDWLGSGLWTTERLLALAATLPPYEENVANHFGLQRTGSIAFLASFKLLRPHNHCHTSLQNRSTMISTCKIFNRSMD